MSGLDRPVNEVGNIVVVGEMHRKSGSRRLVEDVIEKHDFAAVCIEGHPENGLRKNRGGGIGCALSKATSKGVPRYYVDTPTKNVVKAFNGSRLRARRYLKDLDKEIDSHPNGLFDMSEADRVRREFKSEYGEKSYKLLFTDREEKMAARTKYVADNQCKPVLLVVGAGHLQKITELLESGIEPMEVSSNRKFECSRETANLGPWETAAKHMVEGVRELAAAIRSKTGEPKSP